MSETDSSRFTCSSFCRRILTSFQGSQPALQSYHSSTKCRTQRKLEELILTISERTESFDILTGSFVGMQCHLFDIGNQFLGDIACLLRGVTTQLGRQRFAPIAWPGGGLA